MVIGTTGGTYAGCGQSTCMNNQCILYGCQRIKAQPAYTSNSPYPTTAQPVYTPMQQPPKGCICPPTSERTCQRKDCGRK